MANPVSQMFGATAECVDAVLPRIVAIRSIFEENMASGDTLSSDSDDILRYTSTQGLTHCYRLTVRAGGSISRERVFIQHPPVIAVFPGG